MKKVQDTALSMRARIAAYARAKCHASRACRAFVTIPRKLTILEVMLLAAIGAFLVYLVYLMEYLLAHPNYISMPNFSLMV